MLICWTSAKSNNHLETFLFVSSALSGLMRLFLRGFTVVRPPKGTMGFMISSGRGRSLLPSRTAEQVQAASAKRRSAVVLAEHSRVKAVREIHEGDETVPAGATGTIVHVIKGGVGYDVEFTVPRHIVISAARDELAPA
jgi:hypothetical protein